eukprot:TRINITY_DN58628_c0_g2_i1.p1 TRINITY_DN58628_c0_g2~~TRINITY_DN58628_c0_g2_i1.p1  ORF type:complete len:508 (+),score=33.77 TRINITY_DN58628_c0_g2_i1:2-1525(+)
MVAQDTYTTCIKSTSLTSRFPELQPSAPLQSPPVNMEEDEVELGLWADSEHADAAEAKRYLQFLAVLYVHQEREGRSVLYDMELDARMKLSDKFALDPTTTGDQLPLPWELCTLADRKKDPPVQTREEPEVKEQLENTSRQSEEAQQKAEPQVDVNAIQADLQREQLKEQLRERESQLTGRSQQNQQRRTQSRPQLNVFQNELDQHSAPLLGTYQTQAQLASSTLQHTMIRWKNCKTLLHDLFGSVVGVVLVVLWILYIVVGLCWVDPTFFTTCYGLLSAVSICHYIWYLVTDLMACGPPQDSNNTTMTMGQHNHDVELLETSCRASLETAYLDLLKLEVEKIASTLQPPTHKQSSLTHVQSRAECGSTMSTTPSMDHPPLGAEEDGREMKGTNLIPSIGFWRGNSVPSISTPATSSIRYGNMTARRLQPEVESVGEDGFDLPVACGATLENYYFPKGVYRSLCRFGKTSRFVHKSVDKFRRRIRTQTKTKTCRFPKTNAKTPCLAQ